MDLPNEIGLDFPLEFVYEKMSVDRQTLELAYIKIDKLITEMQNKIPKTASELDRFVYLNIMYTNSAFHMYSNKLIGRDEYKTRMETTKLRMMEASANIQSLDSSPCKKKLLTIFVPFYEQLILCVDKNNDDSCTKVGRTERKKAECTSITERDKRSEGLVTTESDKKLLEKWNDDVIMNINKCKLAYERKNKYSIDDTRYLKELSEARYVMSKIFEQYKLMVARYRDGLTTEMKFFEKYFLPFYRALIDCPTDRFACDRAHGATIPFLRMNQL